MRVYLKKKHIKYVLIILAAILVFLALLKLVSWWDSKQGLVDTEGNQTSSDMLSKLPDISVREPTDEERESLAKGELTKEELIQDLVDDAVVHLPNEEQEKEPTTSNDGQEDGNQGSPPSQPIQTEYERRMAEIMAEVYVLRDEYIITLETMYSEAEAALSKLVNKADNEETASLVSYYLTKANDLELQCDEKIDIIVDEMKKLIKENNGDMGLVDNVIKTYATEKATKKAWYINHLKEKGLIS